MQEFDKFARLEMGHIIEEEDDTVVKLLYQCSTTLVSASRQKEIADAMPDLIVPILEVGQRDGLSYIRMPKLKPMGGAINGYCYPKYQYLIPKVKQKVKLLHSRGYIHGDMGFSNILLTEENEPLFCDLDTMMSRKDVDNDPSLLKDLIREWYYIDCSTIDDCMKLESNFKRWALCR